LQDWDQGLAVEMPYDTVSVALARILGFTQSVHNLERNQREQVLRKITNTSTTKVFITHANPQHLLCRSEAWRSTSPEMSKIEG